MGVLEIQVRHKKLISSMEIGRTLIDLEDRWFSPSWLSQMHDQRAPKEVRYRTKKGFYSFIIAISYSTVSDAYVTYWNGFL